MMIKKKLTVFGPVYSTLANSEKQKEGDLF